MNKSHQLRLLVAVNVLLAFATVGAEGFFGWTLPPALAAYKHAQWTSFSINGPWDALRLMLLAITALCAFAAWIGLVTFWRFARGLYLAAIAVHILNVLLSGARVTTSIGAAFGQVNGLVSGAILGLAYFSDLSHRFEAEPAERAAPAGPGLDGV
jgi:hypothetical protein